MNSSKNTVTFHIALSTIPQSENTEETSFLDIIDKEYSALKEEVNAFYKPDEAGIETENSIISDSQILYCPLKYYLFGTYDAAFISLVDRFKFSQRLFSPSGRVNKNDFSFLTNSFQIISGITITDTLSDQNGIRAFLLNNSKDQVRIPPFLGICNIKLNNSLMIGSGYDFIEKVKIIVEAILKEMLGLQDTYAFIQSFSWFEITVLLFVEEVTTISDFLSKIRKVQLFEIDENGLVLTNSLYNKLPSNFLKKSNDDISHSHIIIDTHTYIGIYSEYLSNDVMFSALREKNFENLRSEIEWHVKPGHLYSLIELIKEDENLQDMFDIGKISMLIGKSDYLISNDRTKTFIGNLELFRRLLRPNNFFDHIRKMKSRLFFEKVDTKEALESFKQKKIGVTKFVKELNHLAISISTISSLSKMLKSLKVSRQVRAKLIKTFYNYNNAIQNPILYTFFLDFGHFVFNLILTIEEQNRKFQEIKKGDFTDNDLNIQDIETSLFKLIDIFQEGFNIRMLNCYQYEDITDFDLDFNSSIEQLLSTYNSIVIAIGENIYDTGKGKPVYGPIVRLNLKNTVSNYDSINYNVYNFLAPEFIFFTLLKEVLNHFSYNDNSKLSDDINETKNSFYTRINSSKYLSDFFDSKIIDFDYYYIDSLRYILVCNHDFKLFEYWFWTTNFQNSSMYDAIGVMREKHFKTELFRLCFLARLFNEKIDVASCPIPELENYWERYFHKTITSIEYVFKDAALITKIRAIIFEQIGNSLTKLKIETAGPQEKVAEKRNDERFYELLTNVEVAIARFDTKDDLSKNDKYGYQYGYLRQNAIPRYSNYLQSFYEKNKNNILAGNSPLFSEEQHPALFLYSLMYSYLNILHIENNRKINFLRRNWSNGEPMKCFIDVSDDDVLYFIDQIGSMFFTKRAKTNIYFVMRNGVLQSLWDFANKYKVELFSQINERSQFIKNKYGP